METISNGLKDNEILLRIGLSNDLRDILAHLLDRGRISAKEGNCGNCADCSKCNDCGKCAYCHRECMVGISVPEVIKRPRKTIRK